MINVTACAPADDRLTLSNKEAARLLGLSHRTLEDWRLTKRGPRFVKLGRLVRYRVADLQAFLDQYAFFSTGEASAT